MTDFAGKHVLVTGGTQGIGGACARAFADAGGSVLFHSTEIPELVHMCDRVGVLYEGRLTDWFEGDALTENAVLEAMLGGQEPTVLHDAQHPAKTEAAP